MTPSVHTIATHPQNMNHPLPPEEVGQQHARHHGPNFLSIHLKGSDFHTMEAIFATSDECRAFSE